MAEFKGRHFTGGVNLWAVRWYLMFPVRCRDLERMLADRAEEVDPTIIFRWIQALRRRVGKAAATVSAPMQWLVAGR